MKHLKYLNQLFFILAILNLHVVFAQTNDKCFSRITDTLGINDVYIFELKNITIDSLFGFYLMMKPTYYEKENNFPYLQPVQTAKVWNTKFGELGKKSKLRLNSSSFVFSPGGGYAGPYWGTDRGNYLFYILKTSEFPPGYGDTLLYIPKIFYMKRSDGYSSPFSVEEAMHFNFYFGRKIQCLSDEFALQYINKKTGQQDAIYEFGKKAVFDTLSKRYFLKRLKDFHVMSDKYKTYSYEILDIDQFQFVDDRGSRIIKNNKHEIKNAWGLLKKEINEKKGIACVRIHPIVFNRTTGLLLQNCYTFLIIQ